MYRASSTKLGNHVLKAEGIKRPQVRNHQAHHIIPLQLAERRDRTNLEDYDKEWNCLFLLMSDDAIIHFGSHPNYTEYVESLIDGYMRTHNGSTFLQAAMEVADGVKAWYNANIAKLRQLEVYNVSINNIEYLMGVVNDRINNYIKN